MADAYDLVPYTEHAYAESSPDHLRVVAALAGFSPAVEAPALTPRVLELGCGRGGNLLPLASAWPDATFVGVDRSPGQIRDASRVAEAAELRNVTFVAADFTDEDVTAKLGGQLFDFVLCHGVYSWVPADSRRALLGRIRGVLAERGLAYVSFNTLPGWYRRLPARDFLRFVAHSPAGGAEGPRQALEWLTELVSPEHAAYRADLRAVHERLVATDAAYLTHEYLAEDHHPVYATTFVEEATAAGLAYVADALPEAIELLPEPVQLRVRALDVGRALTLVDFVRDTAFRRAVLARADTAERAGFRPLAPVDASAFVKLRIASRLRPLGDAGASDLESFSAGGGDAETIAQVSGVARRALHALAAAAPRSVRCEELARVLGTAPELLALVVKDLFLAFREVDLHEREPALVTAVSKAPRASAVARWHALEGGPVTNQWHQEVRLPDAIVRFVLGRLDGKETVQELVRAVSAREGDRLSGAEATEIVRASLDLLARAALLVG
jgi:SAM-dependent methyltransferase